ncbi:HAMP domain-containing sensor histidine kinase [Leucobacter luti]|uniref:sensor histidine kinase n=1 Tax=Leucobacter luti TaxID=340320 RepID=UPI001C68957E|nr:HAMP domain-containing sensor histidine kinase [Leucobacter luti]QYM75275.1 HAMP domain-containing histidine kinase [Leucobacter luti]
MRRRLVIVFLIPLLGVLVLLGGGYAWSSAQSVQQTFFAENAGDLSYFVTSARQALSTGNSLVLESEVVRYEELYGARITVVDRTGIPWELNGRESRLDEETLAQVSLALSGRRGETPQAVLPWSAEEMTLVEPVFTDGDVIGAVVLTQSMAAPRGEIVRHWGWLAVIAVLGTGAGVLVVLRLARWVLRPVQRVDEAMAAIEHGDMDARIDDATGPPELQRMIVVFNNMAAEIERVLARQQEFTLNASHELRNPLNALLMRVEMLATGLPESWDEDIEATREEGRRLVRILDTLLSLSKSGHGDPTVRAVDVSELVAKRGEAWREVAARSGVRILVHGESGIVCATDAFVVESALDAILDNAVKFSPTGGLVELAAEHTDESVCIVVRDHGPGVPAAELESMTDRFWRSSGTQNVPGSGLGLAIATDLLASIDGGLEIEEASGGGLRVILRVHREAEL